MLPALVLSALVAATAVAGAALGPPDHQPAGTDFFPDWVPFKNKHGEDLGEFVQVPKTKLKKRLALPVNFILKAVAEPEGDDYLEKSQGGGGTGSDNEEYFEKKEWSDEQRPAQVETSAAAEAAAAAANHTLISDIDDVVDIITKRPEQPVPEPSPQRPGDELKTDDEQKGQQEEPKEDSKRDEATRDEDNIGQNKNDEDTKDDVQDDTREDTKGDIREDSKLDHSSKPDQDADEEEVESDKSKPQNKEQTESEAKKAIILSSVDELKERHAAEQRLISEKVKEEELFKEERERDGVLRSPDNDKYGSKSRLKDIQSDYEEFDDSGSSSEEGQTYRARSSAPSARTGKSRSKSKNKAADAGKLSVFKSPRLYLEYDDSGPSGPRTTSTTAAAAAAAAGAADEGERISLLPASDADSNEPALFFPKKTKSKRRKSKTTPAADSYVAETVAGKTAAEQVAASADVPAAASAITAADAVPASTDHKEEPKVEDYENERGGGRDYHSQHEEDHEEHGKKAYEGLHKDTKTAKGHHDKENHHGEYDDHAGVDKRHHDEAGHYGSHHHEEHGKKHAKYEESGKHAKGHSTKGSHDVHKKEEYEKKVEFFEEEGDSGDEERHGGFHNEREHKEGGHFKKGGLASGHHEHAKGESGHFQKGGHEHAHQAYRQPPRPGPVLPYALPNVPAASLFGSQARGGIPQGQAANTIYATGHAASGGHDEHGRRGHREHQEAGRDSDKKWAYHHGHPAKAARLAHADRRPEQHVHGPFHSYYFG